MCWTLSLAGRYAGFCAGEGRGWRERLCGGGFFFVSTCLYVGRGEGGVDEEKNASYIYGFMLGTVFFMDKVGW